jgi:hypothetical protein
MDTVIGTFRRSSEGEVRATEVLPIPGVPFVNFIVIFFCSGVV